MKVELMELLNDAQHKLLSRKLPIHRADAGLHISPEGKEYWSVHVESRNAYDIIVGLGNTSEEALEDFRVGFNAWFTRNHIQK